MKKIVTIALIIICIITAPLLVQGQSIGQFYKNLSKDKDSTKVKNAYYLAMDDYRSYLDSLNSPTREPGDVSPQEEEIKETKASIAANALKEYIKILKEDSPWEVTAEVVYKKDQGSENETFVSPGISASYVSNLIKKWEIDYRWILSLNSPATPDEQKDLGSRLLADLGTASLTLAFEKMLSFSTTNTGIFFSGGSIASWESKKDTDNNIEGADLLMCSAYPSIGFKLYPVKIGFGYKHSWVLIDRQGELKSDMNETNAIEVIALIEFNKDYHIKLRYYDPYSKYKEFDPVFDIGIVYFTKFLSTAPG